MNTILALQQLDARQRLRDRVSWLDYTHLVVVAEQQRKKRLERAARIQDSKLLRLQLLRAPPELIDPESVIFNKSSRLLTPAEKLALAKGLNYSIPLRRLEYAAYLCPFEKLFRDVKLLPVLDMSTLTRARSRIHDIALNAFYSYNSKCIESNINHEELQTVKSLAADKSIVILKPDKGNGVVLLDRSAYSRKVYDVLEDTGKFTKNRVRRALRCHY